jgi:hypothetical protein
MTISNLRTSLPISLLHLLQLGFVMCTLSIEIYCFLKFVVYIIFVESLCGYGYVQNQWNGCFSFEDSQVGGFYG